MYLDAVIKNREVLYNSIPENVKRYLLGLSEEELTDLEVYDGENLKRWTPGEYIAR